MTTFLIIILLVSQILCFYLIFKKRSERPKKINELTLQPIPNQIKYSDIEPDYKTVYDIFETIKIEEWVCTVQRDCDYFTVDFTSNYGLNVSCRMRESYEIIFSAFLIRENNSILLSVLYSDAGNKQIGNDIISFVWDYVIEYYNNIAKEDTVYLRKMIQEISNKLKTIKRSNRLDEILKK